MSAITVSTGIVTKVPYCISGQMNGRADWGSSFTHLNTPVSASVNDALAASVLAPTTTPPPTSTRTSALLRTTPRRSLPRTSPPPHDHEPQYDDDASRHDTAHVPMQRRPQRSAQRAKTRTE